MDTNYEELVKHNPKIEKILSRDKFEFVSNSNEKTMDVLGETWRKHMRKNLRTLYKRHGLLNDHCKGFGFGKAVIGIGAGPSFNRNKHIIKRMCEYNARFDFENQPFLFICANHQFKPCLDYGIIPNFVIWVDASEVVYDQLCTDIPKIGRNTTLIASLHCHPKVLREWDRQGRIIQFYIPIGIAAGKLFEKVTKRKVDGLQIAQGGNVMNAMWCSSTGILGSRIFMATGNDLSYEVHEDVDKRRQSYYADGDYSTNLGTKRDEAGRQFKWLGFEMRNGLVSDTPVLDFKPMATVHSLYTYKTWIEIQVAIQDVIFREKGKSFHYYNCSEKGILGVMPKSEDKVDLDNKDNWVLMDDIFPQRWHTRMLEHAVYQYLEARVQWQEIKRNAGNVQVLPGLTDTVRSIAI